MLDISMEFRKGILFIRLNGDFNIDGIKKFNDEVKEVIIKAGIKNVVLNVNGLNYVIKAAVDEIKKVKKIIKKTGGMFFLISSTNKEFKHLVNLENELNVFEKVVI